MFRILAILLIAALPVRATPPDTIFINERLIGVNDSHLFFLRTTNDNLGLHIFGMKDTYLVAKNIDTRQDDDIWPVFRQHGAPDYHPDTGAPTPNIQTFPLKGAVNPFAILADHGALQIESPFGANSIAEFEPIPAEGLTINEFSLPADELMAQMEQAVAMTLSAIQPYPDTGFASMTFSTPQNLLGDWTADPSQCSQQGDIEVSPIYGMRIIHLAQIECWDVTQEQPAMLFVIMDPVIKVEY